MVRLPRNEEQTYPLNFIPQIRPSGYILGMTLRLNFQAQIWICYISAKNGPIATKLKANISIELASNVTMTLTLKFQGQF